MDIVEFLLARVAEEEWAALSASRGPWVYKDIDSVGGGTLYDPDVAIAGVEWDTESVDPRIRRFRTAGQADATGEHIARHNPSHVLAGCAGRRAIIELHKPWTGKQFSDKVFCSTCIDYPIDTANVGVVYPCPTLRLLALPYEGHPDYKSRQAS